MKKLLFTILTAVCFTSLSAQVTLGTQAVSAAGDYYSGSWGSLSVNIAGEPVIETISGGNAVFTQGFEQPKFKGTGIISLPANAPTISLFPNPTSDAVNLAFNLTQGGKLAYRLFDMSGRELSGTAKNSQPGQQTEQLDLSNLSQGLYMLNIIFEANDNTKSFSVVKRIEVVR